MDSITSKQIADFKNDKSRIIVAICGAADLGKSYFAKQVVKNLNSAGKCGDSFETIKPCSVLIFDDVQSMHETFLAYIDVSIFFYTEDESLRKIRYEADLEKRQYSTNLAKSNSESEFSHYKKQIAPYKQKADFILFLEKKWKYQIQS